MITIYDFEQGSPEWNKAREGNLTGSNATPIGANGKGLETYCKDIAMELVGIKIDRYSGWDMKRGDELEPFGTMAYELEKEVAIRLVGGCTNSKFKDVWVSPDGLIGEDGGIEMKARNEKKHFALITGDTSEIPFNQIQMCLMITERKYWDFLSFNPNVSKPLFIKRIYPDPAYHEKLKAGLYRGNKLIKQYTEEYNNFKN